MSILAASGVQVGSNLPIAFVVAGLLLWASVRIARRVAHNDLYPTLFRVAVISAVLHLLCAPAQIFVVDHFYGGVADWLRYDHQGALLASNYHAGHLTLAGTGIHRILGDGSVSIASGIVMTIVGQDQLAAFFVFTWLAFVGIVFFYKAFVVTFPEANCRRYALLVFFFPSLLFWNADVSKESIMTLALGLTVYGMARILMRERHGYLYVIPGGALALIVRPDELILLVVGFAVALVLRTRIDRREARSFGRSLADLSFVTVAVVISILVTERFVHSAGGSSLTGILNTVSTNNSGVGVGFGTSNVPYSSNPLYFPRDVYNVLFNPLPFTAHSVTQLIASLENTVIAVAIVMSLPNLRLVFRAGRARPYVAMAFVYCVAFVFIFAALGNLGLITRERTLVLPMLLVLLAIPIGPQDRDPYPWQLTGRARRKALATTTYENVPTGSGFVEYEAPGEHQAMREWEVAHWVDAGWRSDDEAQPTSAAETWGTETTTEWSVAEPWRAGDPWSGRE